MASIFARLIKKDSQSLRANASDELEVKIKSGGFLQRTVDGLEVMVNDTVTALTNLWSAQKISDELSSKASIAYVDNAVNGLNWKAPVINAVTQATLDGLSPNEGDRYLITDGANINKIASYSSGWTYTTPLVNWTLIKKSDDLGYTYDADSGDAFKWVAIGTVGQSEVRVQEKKVLSGTDITNKNVSLTYVPVGTSMVNLDIVGGCVQQNGVDFTVSGQTLSWSGTPLDGLLIAGDVLVIVYSKSS